MTGLCMPRLTPHQATAAQVTPLSAVGAVTTRQNLAPALTQRPLYSVRDAIGNFTKMLKPWGDQEKYPFSFRMRQWWPPQHKGGVGESVFPCKKVSFSFFRDA